jgi:excisionase family DNA binding protein
MNTSSPQGPQRPVPATADVYLTADEVSALLKVPVKTLAAWRSQRKGPLFHRFGVHVRYPATELDLWLSERHDEAQKWMAS